MKFSIPYKVSIGVKINHISVFNFETVEDNCKMYIKNII